MTRFFFAFAWLSSFSLAACLTVTPVNKGDAGADAAPPAPTSSDAGSPKDIAIATCRDLAQAFGEKGRSCGQDFQTHVGFFLDANADGDCARVLSVRDGSARSTCPRELGAVACSDYFQGRLPSSCVRVFRVEE
jgi:hypothetical protein